MIEFSREKPTKLSLEVKEFQKTMRGLGVKKTPETGSLEVNTSPRSVGRIQKEIRKKLESLSPKDRECFQAQICGAFTDAVESLNKEPEIEESKLLRELDKLSGSLAVVGIFGQVATIGLAVLFKVTSNLNLAKTTVGIGSGTILSMGGHYTAEGIVQGEIGRKRAEALKTDYQRVITKQLIPDINQTFGEAKLNYRIIPDTTEEGLKYILLRTEEVR